MPDIQPAPRLGSVNAQTASPVQSQPRHVDTVAEPTTPVVTSEPTKQPGADRLAIIARKEQALRQQQLALKAEREAMQGDKGSREAERAELERLRAREKRLAEDPYSVMLEQGMTADQVAAKLLNQPNPADQRVLLLEQELKALKAANEKTSTKVDEQATAQRDAAIKQIDADVKMLVDADPQFETIKARNAQAAVTALIVDIYDNGDPADPTNRPAGTMLSNEEAAQIIEDFLLEEAMTLAQLPKVQTKLGAKQAALQEELAKKPVQPAKQPGPATLSNRMTPSTTKTLTWAERRARAIAVAEGKTPN